MFRRRVELDLQTDRFSIRTIETNFFFPLNIYIARPNETTALWVA